MHPANASAPPALPPMRWVICALLFFATTINYMDRQILGILAPVLEREIGWNEVGYGHIVTAFQAAYALGLLGFGRLLDTVGTRIGYSVSVAFWSFAAMAHALASTVLGFGAARFALGLGEAGCFPASVKAVAEWFPARERALATGVFNAGANVGTILAPAAVPWLAAAWGWRAAFVALGATGFVWLVFWIWLYHTPRPPGAIAAPGAAAVHPAPPASVPWRVLLTHRQTWACVIPLAFSAPIWWFYLYWLPKFLSARHGLTLSALGSPLMVIYSMTCVGSIAGGWLSSALLRRGHSTNFSRKIVMLGCAVCVLPVCLAPVVHGLWTATFLIGLAAAAHQGWATNVFAVVADLFPKRAVASALALGLTAGSLTSMAFSQAVGFILQSTGSYWTLFAFAAGAYVVALVLMHALSPRLEPLHLEN